MAKKKYVKGKVLQYVGLDTRFSNAYKAALETPEDELKEVYQTLKEVARKRLNRLKNQNEIDVEREIQNLEQAMIGIRDLTGSAKQKQLKLAQATLKLYHILEGKQTTIKDIKRSREDTIRRLRESGVESVNLDNITEFGLFMEYSRSILINELFDSREVAQAYEDYAKRAGEEDITVAEYFDSYFNDFMESQGYAMLSEEERGVIRGGRGGEARLHRASGRMSRGGAFSS